MKIRSNHVRRTFSWKVTLLAAIVGPMVKFTGSFASPLYLFYSPAKMDVSFQASAKGSLAEGILQVPVRDGYTFYLHLQSKPGDLDEREVQRTAGAGIASSSGLPTSYSGGPSLLLRLQVTDVTRGAHRVIIDGEYSHQALEKGADRDFWNYITGVQLDKGTYDVRMETLENRPDLENINTFLAVHVPYRS